CSLDRRRQVVGRGAGRPNETRRLGRDGDRPQGHGPLDSGGTTDRDHFGVGPLLVGPSLGSGGESQLPAGAANAWGRGAFRWGEEEERRVFVPSWSGEPAEFSICRRALARGWAASRRPRGSWPPRPRSASARPAAPLIACRRTSRCSRALVSGPTSRPTIGASRS